MRRWVIALTFECSDGDHMRDLQHLTHQYLRAAMERTKRHDALLVESRLDVIEEPVRAATDSSA